MQTNGIAALLVVLATASFAQNRLNLAVGSQKTLSLPGIQRVALGDPEVADVKTLGNNELLVVGMSAGHTTLLVWKAGASTPQRFELSVSGPGSTVAPAPRVPADVTPAPTFSPTLKVGEQTTRAVANVERIALGDPDIADARPATGSLTLVGLKPGQTTVMLWFADGHREQWPVTVVK